MSIRVMSKVWDSAPVAGSDLLALLALADWSDDAGRCYPGMAAIARKIRLQERQAQRVVHRLIDAGFVHVTGNGFGGAPGSTRQYRIDLEKLKAVESSDTGVAHDTPDNETGVFQDGDGCLPRRETGVSDDTQTVNEPSVNRQREAPRSPKGSRLSADWSLPTDWKAWVQQERPDIQDPGIQRIADSFADYWKAKPGKDGIKLDWFAVWRNWIRREQQPNRSQRNQRQQFSKTTYGTGGAL